MLILSAVVSQVFAQVSPYEVEAVGGVLEPANMSLTLTQAVTIAVAVSACIGIIALLRSKGIITIKRA